MQTAKRLLVLIPAILLALHLYAQRTRAPVPAPSYDPIGQILTVIGGVNTGSGSQNGSLTLPSASGGTVTIAAVTGMAGGSQVPADLSGHHPLVLESVLGSSDSLVAATINVTETPYATTPYSIPANYLVANKTIRVTWNMDELTSVTPVTQRVRVRLGGTGINGVVVWDSTAVTPTASINTGGSPRGFRFSCIFDGTAAAGASVNVLASCGADILTPTVPFAVANTVAEPIGGVATNGALPIYLTMQYGGNTAGNQTDLLMRVSEEMW